MSRLTGADAYSLMEAYQAVYAPQELTEEQVWEEVETWVNSLLEEGYDLSDYTWEEMYESYLEEKEGIFNNDITRGIGNYARSLFSNPQNKTAANSGQFGRYGAPSAQVKTPTAKPAAPARPIATSPAAPRPAAPRPAAGAPAKPAATAAPKPAAATTTAAKPAPATTTAAKPSAMDQFAKANPKLAAASAERARTRGTSATTNPLMKDMKSRLPAPKTPSPTTAKTGFDLAKKGVNLASGFDYYDAVKGYLIGEGYADTEEAALAIMINMSEEWKQSIIKSI